MVLYLQKSFKFKKNIYEKINQNIRNSNGNKLYIL